MHRFLTLATLTVTFALLILMPLNSTPLTDKAYIEYKKGNYKKALYIYRKAYRKERSPKALYNIATFYYKGLGVKKDKRRAKRLYNRYIDLVQKEIDDLSICYKPKLLYVKKALKKVGRYGELRGLKRECHKCNHNRSCGDSSNSKGKEKGKKRGEKRKESSDRCPILKKVVERRYWREAQHYECELFKRFPNIMRKHFKDKAKFKEFSKRFDDKSVNRIRKKVKSYVKPLLRYYKKRELKCTERAKTEGELLNCSNSYILSMGNLIFIDYAPMLFDSIAFSPKSVKREYKKALSHKRRREAIEKIKRELMNENYFIE